MPTALLRLECYHKHHTRQRLQLVLPAAQVEEQLQVIEQCHIATELPWEDIAGPYLHLIVAGHPLTKERLLQLLQWSIRLQQPFDSFVLYFALPYVLQGPRALVSELDQIFAAAA
jgi:hypothetical protein